MTDTIADYRTPEAEALAWSVGPHGPDDAGTPDRRAGDLALRNWTAYRYDGLVVLKTWEGYTARRLDSPADADAEIDRLEKELP